MKANSNDELRALVMEMAKQNIALGQRIDTLGQRIDTLGQRIDAVTQAMVQQNIALGQRMDTVIQEMAKQNIALGQRMDTSLQHIDAAVQQTNQHQLEIVRMFSQIYSVLEKLPEALREQIGYKKLEH